MRQRDSNLLLRLCRRHRFTCFVEFVAGSFILILIDFATLIRSFVDAWLWVCMWTWNIWIKWIKSSAFSVGIENFFSLLYRSVYTIWRIQLFIFVFVRIFLSVFKYNSCVFANEMTYSFWRRMSTNTHTRMHSVYKTHVHVWMPKCATVVRQRVYYYVPVPVS